MRFALGGGAREGSREKQRGWHRSSLACSSNPHLELTSSWAKIPRTVACGGDYFMLALAKKRFEEKLATAPKGPGGRPEGVET